MADRASTTSAERPREPSEVHLPVEDGEIVGDLHHGPMGTVIFAHGSGSSRFSSRNRRVGARLRREGLGTLLLDLLTEDEEAVDVRTREHRFDIDRLSDRVVLAVAWIRERSELRDGPIGLFGSSTGAAAALSAAAERPADVAAVVSRGGRTDLARVPLERVEAPTRLIVGERDPQVLAINERSLQQLGGPRDLQVVPGATHLFEEPGALERVADLAAEWFFKTMAEAGGGAGAAHPAHM